MYIYIYIYIYIYTAHPVVKRAKTRESINRV